MSACLMRKNTNKKRCRGNGTSQSAERTNQMAEPILTIKHGKYKGTTLYATERFYKIIDFLQALGMMIGMLAFMALLWWMCCWIMCF